MNRLRNSWLLVVTHVAALSPLALLIWDYAKDQLTVNPIEDIQQRTGRYALTFLVITLACTPIYTFFGVSWVMKLRRPLGLYTFMYANLHFLNFVVLDYWFQFDLMWIDVGEKRFALAGLASFLLLIPLALTSTGGLRKRHSLAWSRIHWFIYPGAILAIIHFIWQVKADLRQPLIYGIIVFIILFIRLPVIRKLAGEPQRRIRALLNH